LRPWGPLGPHYGAELLPKDATWAPWAPYGAELLPKGATWVPLGPLWAGFVPLEGHMVLGRSGMDLSPNIPHIDPWGPEGP